MEQENSETHKMQSVTGEQVQLSGETYAWLFEGEPEMDAVPAEEEAEMEAEDGDS